MSTFPVPLHNGRRAVPSSGYGPRGSGFHRGLDFTFPMIQNDWPRNQYTVEGRFFHPVGLPALAADDGVVTRATVTSTGGYIMIDHGGGYATQYIHLRPKSFRVKVGDQVREGQPIAEIGWNLSHPEGDIIHLHFQMLLDGTLVDPEPYTNKWRAVKNPWLGNGLLVVAVIGLGSYAYWRYRRKRARTYHRRVSMKRAQRRR